jgi:hypothetical protein
MAHRLFPGLSALWFAALFGLGGLAASADAMAGLVLHLHLPAILPAASLPLGLTAHLLAALALAGLGGVLGLALGVVLYTRAGGVLPARPQRAAPDTAPQPARTRSVKPASDVDAASAPRVRNRDAHPDAPPRRPLVVSDDVLPYAATMFEPAPEPVIVPAPEPVIVPPVEDPFATEQNHLARDGSAPEPDEPAHDLPPFLAAAWSASQRNDSPIFIPPAEPIILPAVPEPVAAEGTDAHAVEPEAVLSEAIGPGPAAIATPAPPVSLPPLASLAAAAPQVPLSEAPLASLGLVQLIERLALAIATRQARHTAPPAPMVEAVDPLAPLHRFDPLTMDPTGPLLRAKPARFEQVRLPDVDAPEDVVPDQAVPMAGLHDPLASADAWSDDDPADHLPPRFLRAPAVEGQSADPFGADDGIVEQRYSSLVGMALPRPELVPSEFAQIAAQHDQPGEPGPVVPFPQRLSGGDHDAASTAPELAPNDADHALREALATLRRMSAQR